MDAVGNVGPDVFHEGRKAHSLRVKSVCLGGTTCQPVFFAGCCGMERFRVAPARDGAAVLGTRPC